MKKQKRKYISYTAYAILILTNNCLAQTVKKKNAPVNKSINVAASSEDIQAGKALISYIRNDMGNKASITKPADVKKVTDEHKGREKNWTIQELQNTKK